MREYLLKIPTKERERVRNSIKVFRVVRIPSKYECDGPGVFVYFRIVFHFPIPNFIGNAFNFQWKPNTIDCL